MPGTHSQIHIDEHDIHRRREQRRDARMPRCLKGLITMRAVLTVDRYTRTSTGVRAVLWAGLGIGTYLVKSSQEVFSQGTHHHHHDQPKTHQRRRQRVHGRGR